MNKCRTRQEEMRTARKNQSFNAIIADVNGNTTSLNINSTETFKKESLNSSLVLSTDMCIYIYGALLASIFIIGLMR